MPSKSSKDNVVKHYKSGLELEFFTLDQNGGMINGGEQIIEEVKKLYPEIQIKKEVSKNMAEVSTEAEISIPNLGNQLVSDLEKILAVVQANQMLVYPFGTYPGNFTPEIIEDNRYKNLQKIFGKQRFAIAGRVTGLHYHFTLPKGVFDESKRNIKNLILSKHKESMINTFNLFTAMDPALACFAQSSPFYQAKFLGKDSRMIVYRGGEIFSYPQGYSALFDKKYGGLHSYMATGTDLLGTIERQYDFFKDMLGHLKINVKTFLKHRSILSATWAPVRINAQGTTEHRGMDANLPSIILGLALMIKFIAKEIQEKFIEVQPSDQALENPFAYDEKKLLIPPDTHVRTLLQPKSALEGLENEQVFSYCAGLLKLAKGLVPENRQGFLKPLEEMLKERKTMSDIILKKAKDLGWQENKELRTEQARELAIHFSQELYKDLIKTKQTLSEFKE